MLILIVLTKTKVSITTCHPKEERCVTRQRQLQGRLPLTGFYLIAFVALNLSRFASFFCFQNVSFFISSLSGFLHFFQICLNLILNIKNRKSQIKTHCFCFYLFLKTPYCGSTLWITTKQDKIILVCLPYYMGKPVGSRLGKWQAQD